LPQIREDGAMAAQVPELSSITSTLEQLLARVGGMAEAARRDKEEEVARELFEVERSLSSAQRRLGRMLDRSR